MVRRLVGVVVVRAGKMLVEEGEERVGAADEVDQAWPGDDGRKGRSGMALDEQSAPSSVQGRQKRTDQERRA